MTNKALATLGASALILGAAAIGTGATPFSLAAASSHAQSKEMKLAARYAAKSGTALAKHKLAIAIQYAEAAVTLSPQDPSYRTLLGNAYLRAGRFASARDAFTDSLTLSPADGHTALSLALAQTASGDWAAARKTLDDHADLIPVPDRGLAMALAGDPASAVELLMAAARGPGSDAKTRQNLALSLALAGRWPEAKSVAALDLAPADADARIIQWANFAHPTTASDQVASLLGVTAVADDGQPVALALNAAVPARLPMAATETASEAPAAMAEAAPITDPAPAAEVVAVEAPVEPTATRIVFGPRNPVVQAIPAKAIRAATMPATGGARPAAVTSRPVPAAFSPQSKGNYYVQIGAYENAAIARDGWMRATRRYPALAGQTPSGMSVKSGRGSFYRLSVGGFSQGDANALCAAYRAAKGICFVRTEAGDQIAQWVQAPRQLASR